MTNNDSPTYLGLDLGTSSFKALMINEGGKVIISVSVPLQVSRPHPGWSEQDPTDWVAAAEQVIDSIHKEKPQALASLRGIGLSGHMHGATLIGKGDTPLRPCILWNDTRAQDEAVYLDRDPRFRKISGNIVFAGFTAPKTLWVAKYEPEIFSQVSQVLLPKDYLRLWLTGERVSEMSDASGTSWLDTGNRCWSEELLMASRMRLDQMPSLIEGNQVSGVLRPELARRWNLKNDVVVAGGAGDNAASAIAAGVITPGRGFISLGTSGVLFRADDDYHPKPDSAVHTFCHALPNTWHRMGVILSAASALTWLAGLVGVEETTLIDELGSELKSPGEVVFLPYLSGERTPHNDGELRASFHGLSQSSGRAQLTQAVLEGVGYALKDNQIALQETEVSPQPLLALGGGDRSRYWLKLIATLLGVDIHLPQPKDYGVTHGASFGAARLGMMADRQEKNPQKLCLPPRIAEEITPDPILKSAFEEGYLGFKKLEPK